MHFTFFADFLSTCQANDYLLSIERTQDQQAVPPTVTDFDWIYDLQVIALHLDFYWN